MRFIVPLACLASLGHGRRVQMTSERIQGRAGELQGAAPDPLQILSVLLKASNSSHGAWQVSGPAIQNFAPKKLTARRAGLLRLQGGAVLVKEEDKTVTHPAYEIIDSSSIEEYGLHVITYEHKKSGTEVISVIAPEDSNKVFGAVFRTPPEDSTGLPHILEHSVLCGSRKFPVKEPFVDLIKGSLNTFLNAFTYPDRTCYPVASMNTKDFYNLIDVYLDAVLHPRAINDPQVLQQEGWHYEIEDPAKPLEYKGVVYNEMKGVYSSPDSIRNRGTQQALFPDNTYGVDSGGDPRRIPDLDFKQFKDFHSKYYHPSNSRMYFYGDDDPLKRLEILDEYLKDFDKIEIDSTVKYQKKIQEEKRLEIPFPVQPGRPAKHTLTVNWLLNDEPMTEAERLAVDVLDSLMLGRSSSPLRKKLTESGLGDSVVGGGLSDQLLQATFSVGLKGVKPENASKVEALVQEEINRLAKEGFDEGDIKAAMNTEEFGLREFNTGGFPKGLSVMLRMANRWNYDQNPLEGVRFEKPLQKLKDDLAAGKPVFQDLLKKYFVSNKHKAVVEMIPDTELEKANQEWEEKVLADAKEAMSSSDIEEAMSLTSELKAAQKAEDPPEAKATLPKLGLEDIEREVETLPIEVEQLADGVQVLTHDLQTSGILYADIAFDMSSIKEDDIVLIPLLTRMLTESGTTDLDEVQLGRRIGSETGGLGVSTFTSVKSGHGTLADMNDPLMYLMARGKATKDKIPNLLGLVKNVLLDSRLDNKKRAIEILKETKTRQETAVITAGQRYGGSRLSARHSLLGYLGEATGGLTYMRNLASLLEEAEADWPKVQARLEAMRSMIVQKGDVVINLTGNREVLDSAKPTMEEFVGQIPASGTKGTKLADSWSASKLVPIKNEGFSVPSQVNYVVKGAPIFEPGEAIKGSYSVASRFLSTGFLWDNVRVMGGAYGGFTQFGASSGIASFLSYRDPNLADTLSIYDRAADVLEEEAANLSDEDLLTAIIGTVGGLDRPMTADTKGYVSMVRHLTGETTEDRQRWRNEVIDTSKEDLLEYAKKLRAVKASGSTVVFGSQAALDSANEVLPADDKLEVEPAIPAKD
mmetsp:Transcript_64393/g.112423  ORF Transcript_64393/g.112423 Transcript_64393/m.112423 type:complete len:1091 (+) Transcript_64393:80-3352(+)